MGTEVGQAGKRLRTPDPRWGLSPRPDPPSPAVSSTAPCPPAPRPLQPGLFPKLLAPPAGQARAAGLHRLNCGSLTPTWEPRCGEGPRWGGAREVRASGWLGVWEGRAREGPRGRGLCEECRQARHAALPGAALTPGGSRWLRWGAGSAPSPGGPRAGKGTGDTGPQAWARAQLGVLSPQSSRTLWGWDCGPCVPDLAASPPARCRTKNPQDLPLQREPGSE